ncbi:SF3a splicing factor complex subunit [Ceratobasidium sp. 394]|nr:SF3a splicing factor complex subunit [Ceratobasidium sp. 394]
MLYTARSGRPFLNTLQAREARNFQFDFLRPNHSLFGPFNRLIGQYTCVLHPPKKLLAKIALHATPEGKRDMLAEACEHAAYERWHRERKKKKEHDKEAKHVVFAEIEWRDYYIVQTIKFTAADATSDLPPPMSIAKVKNMMLAQKRTAVWKIQRDNLEMCRAQASELQRGANVVTSLHQLVQTRMGIFGADANEEARKKEEEEEHVRCCEREKVGWDSHAASEVGTLDKFQTNANLDKQVAVIHKTKLGLGAAVPANMIGPSVGPGGTDSSLPINPSLPANPTTFPPLPLDLTGVYSALITYYIESEHNLDGMITVIQHSRVPAFLCTRILAFSRAGVPAFRRLPHIPAFPLAHGMPVNAGNRRHTRIPAAGAGAGAGWTFGARNPAAGAGFRLFSGTTALSQNLLRVPTERLGGLVTHSGILP